MSEHYSMNIPAHPNIYNGNVGRELRIDFSTPDSGVNQQTGLLVFVPGFGGNIDSKVYKKMRKIFADKYNLVTIQCNYFGSSYMQDPEKFTADRRVLKDIFTVEELEKINHNNSMLFSLLRDKNVVLPMKTNLNETLEEFNDMSYMQAIDIISAIEAIKITLLENNLVFNSNRIIGFGHSHGAYLLHLSNVLAPNLFSFIVDNSAWMEPLYFTNTRYLSQKLDNAIIEFQIDYLAKEVITNKADLNLSTLYKKYYGTTQILSFQGNNDNFINHKEKQCFLETINNSKFILVTEEDVDNKRYKTNTHGLGADFLDLLCYALEFESPIPKNNDINTKYMLDFSGVHIDVDYTYGLPIFNFIFK